MHTKADYRKWAITILLLGLPPFLAFFTVSCDRQVPVPVYEIVGQQLTTLVEGKYDDILIEVSYVLKQIGTAAIATPPTLAQASRLCS